MLILEECYVCNIEYFFIYVIFVMYFIFMFIQSSSSTESDSLPFANENAGTIKQRAGRAQEYVPGGSNSGIGGHVLNHHSSGEPADVLNDIGNMLANLTDELDAMLEEEKRQGLNS